ncbi:hypothetical protein PGT21_010546 [Puccinia graminis f. sp. tritici]|uniref:Uncharacterized protein n=1 Tax=Puccinia graminis f. sp. tritici TaxID=56615 RepID=A0A5B0NIZ9_PUCGR|nr:hypothetical protein PGT21_010546 [Puccinia graminis f. sp. tritici]
MTNCLPSSTKWAEGVEMPANAEMNVVGASLASCSELAGLHLCQLLNHLEEQSPTGLSDLRTTTRCSTTDWRTNYDLSLNHLEEHSPTGRSCLNHVFFSNLETDWPVRSTNYDPLFNHLEEHPPTGGPV